MDSPIYSGYKINQVISFTMETCITCGIPFFMPTDHRNALSKGTASTRNFYCPNGHSMRYTGETKIEQLQKQIDALTKSSEAKLSKAYEEKYELQKQLNDTRKTPCPHCNKSYIHLDKHIAKNHPFA